MGRMATRRASPTARGPLDRQTRRCHRLDWLMARARCAAVHQKEQPMAASSKSSGSKSSGNPGSRGSRGQANSGSKMSRSDAGRKGAEVSNQDGRAQGERSRGNSNAGKAR